MKRRRYSDVGKLIVAEMARRNITLQEAADLFGMPRKNYLSKIIRNHTRIGRKYEEAVCRFVGIDGMMMDKLQHGMGKERPAG